MTSSAWLRRLAEDGVFERSTRVMCRLKSRRCSTRSCVSSRSSTTRGYFLTMYEIVSFCARARHHVPGPRLGGQLGGLLLPRHHRGRSACAWSLLFERFLSRERAEPPDIDLDIEHERREEVIQHVYDGTAAITPRWCATSSATARARPCATSARRSAFPETALDRAAKQLSHHTATSSGSPSRMRVSIAETPPHSSISCV